MILFLDFDGVLHPFGAGSDRRFCCAPLLWQILDACPAVQVVFSTAWREDHPLDKLTECATAGGGEHLAARFIGATPDLCPPGSFFYPRHREVAKWIDDAGYTGPWLALDDDEDLFAGRGLYLVDSATGLTTADADAIINLLSR